MNPEPEAAPQSSPSPQRYELWRPVIRAERRRALEQIHHDLAAEWSRDLLERLDHADPVRFEGIGLEDFARFGESCQAVQVVFFAIERTPIAGVLALGSDLARHLVDARFGSPAPQPAAANTFSRLEMGLVRQTLDQLVERLGDAYARAGIGRLRVTRVCEQLGDMLLFAPDDCLIVFRFRVGEQGSPLKLSIAANTDLMKMVKELAPASRRARASERLVRTCREIPIDARVVLGAWRARLREVAGLKPGDSIVLPDGADAWLEANGIRIGRVKVEVDGRRLTVAARPREGANGRN